MPLHKVIKSYIVLFMILTAYTVNTKNILTVLFKINKCLHPRWSTIQT